MLRAYVAFAGVSAYVVCLSIFDLPPALTLFGAARMCFVFPFAYLAAVFIRTDEDVHSFLRLFAILIALGALSLPLQTITGPISWFAESSTRGGFERYSTIFGNLTAMGTVGGLALIALFFVDINGALRFVLIACVLVGMLLSLQKAAIINLLLVVPVYIALGGGTTRQRLMLGARILVAGLVIGAIIFAILGPEAFASVQTVFRIGAAADAMDDVTVNASIVQRLLTLPMVLYDLYGPTSVVTGVGLKGAGGVMGMPEAPMSHNNFFDLLFLGGVAYLLSFVALLWYSMRGALRARVVARTEGNHLAYRNLQIIVGVLVIFMINLPVASGTIFQPNISSIFWLSVGILAGPYARLAAARRP